MKAAIKLPADKRENYGKGPARALRREGKIPAVIYGPDTAPVSIAVEQKAIAHHCTRIGFMSQIFDLDIDGKTFRVLPKQVQLHPVTDIPEHADFLSVKDDTQVKVLVKVRFINEDRAPGLKRGGTLNIVRRELELLCLAANIPTTIEIDVAGLQIGDSIHISHVKLPEGATPAITDRDFTVAAVIGRKAEEEETAEGTEGAEGEEGAEGDDDKAEGDDEKKDGGK